MIVFAPEDIQLPEADADERDHLTDPPWVTRQEFDAIECNRCGQCCEGFYLDSPLKLLTLYSGFCSIVKEWKEYIAFGGTETGSYDRWLPREQAMWNWIEHITPVAYGPCPGNERGKWKYECNIFARDENGVGCCTQYEKRCYVCRDFPYGEPVEGFPSCTWRVVVINEPGEL